MNEIEKEKILELLSGQAFGELSEAELTELEELEKIFPELSNDESFELAAAKISLINLNTSEPLPMQTKTKILADAEKFFAAENSETISEKNDNDFQKVFAFEKPKPSFMNWLGWSLAGLACIALAVNLWMTRVNPTVERVYVPQPMPIEPNVTQQFEKLLSTPDVVKINLSNPKKSNEIMGDAIWSNSAQKGFLRFRAMPVNDVNKETYQLWIIDKTQKQPIDGGVFDITQSGEIIIPIDAKLKVKEPIMFAVTAEKPGGVVVSSQEKVMAVAKIET